MLRVSGLTLGECRPETLATAGSTLLSNIEKQKRAFVTGGSRGVGFEVANYLRDKGWTVTTFARSNADITGDVADSATLEAAIIAAAIACPKESEPGLDLLICSASAAAGGTMRDMPIAEIAKTVRADLIGSMFAVKLALPHLVSRPRGTIVLISSMASFHGIPGFAAYSATKAAVNNFAEALRLEEPTIAVITVVLGTVADKGEPSHTSWSSVGGSTLKRSREFRFFRSASEPVSADRIAEALYATLGRSATIFLPASLRWMEALSRHFPSLFRLCVMLYQRHRLPAVLRNPDQPAHVSDKS